jgi:ligand-binding SRPBCC domain-containing protein
MMAVIHLTTFIAASAERVFNLSRSIDLHKLSTAHTGEQAIGGIKTGLIQVNETVTWQARHLFKTRVFTSQITAMEPHTFFCDEMTTGDFKKFRHEHYFKPAENGVVMIDIVEFESPWSFIGRLFNKLYLKNYLKNLLVKRNDTIREYAVTDKWKLILN